ncbi:MAG: hypothetical protein ABI833_20445 [Acidobacteriota bacterium]
MSEISDTTKAREPNMFGMFKEMHRGVHIAVALLGVILLLHPFDCFAGGKFDQKAADCCKKGKCHPSANSDDCCKGTLPGGKQLVSTKASDHSLPIVDLIVTASVKFDLAGPLLSRSRLIEVESTPGSPPDLRLNLPLLI